VVGIPNGNAAARAETDPACGALINPIGRPESELTKLIPTTTARKRPGMALVVGASAAASAFEWYDFYIFGTLTPVISANSLQVCRLDYPETWSAPVQRKHSPRSFRAHQGSALPMRILPSLISPRDFRKFHFSSAFLPRVGGE
jgi:hypothetical protein